MKRFRRDVIKEMIRSTTVKEQAGKVVKERFQRITFDPQIMGAVRAFGGCAFPSL